MAHAKRKHGLCAAGTISMRTRVAPAEGQILRSAAKERGDMKLVVKPTSQDTHSKEAIDIMVPVRELADADPELSELLFEMGFENLPENKTIPEIATEAGVSPAVVVFALEASGYDVQGFVAPDTYDEEESPIFAMLTYLFDEQSNDEAPQAADATSISSSPMLVHMEAAIRRAKRDGRLN